MRVQGNHYPEIIEVCLHPAKRGYSQAWLRENIKDLSTKETNLFEYDEYVLSVPSQFNLKQQIQDNLSDWMQTGRMLEYNDNASAVQDMKSDIVTISEAGAKQVQTVCETLDIAPSPDSGVFVLGVAEWQPETEYKKHDLFSYQGSMGYVKQPSLTSQELYPPFSTGTEALYGARPKPDADGIYPYVYNMGIFEGMRVRGNDGLIYKSISGTYENPTELLYPPEDAPSLFVKEGEETNPDEEYKEWIQPTGAHDAYGLGAKVSHNGEKYISQIDGNTYEPGTDERWWKKVIE